MNLALRTVMLTLLCLLAAACLDRSPFAPGLDEPLRSESLAPPPTEGCARFTVDLSEPGRMAVTGGADAGCGALHVVLEGEANFNGITRTLRLPLALENRGSGPLGAPATLRSGDHLLEIVEGAAAGEEAPLLLFLNADSIAVDPASEALVHHLWGYGDQLPEWEDVPFLKPSERSEPRFIEIAVDPAVSVFSVGFEAEATVPEGWEGRPWVPKVPPDGFISEEVRLKLYAHGNLGSYGPGGSPFPRNLIVLMFQRNAGQAERQAIIDRVGGEVVGGLPLTGDGDGIYYIRIEDDGTTGPLFDVIDWLSEQSEVFDAGPNLIYGFSPSHLRPNDGEGWRKHQWMLSPDSARGANWGPEAIAAPMA